MNIGGSKLKLLVTGASGFIGHEVAHQLVLAGFRPRLMIAHPKDDCEICHLDADFVLADLTKPKTLKDAVRGVDGIIHLAGHATFESFEILKPTILDGSMALMEAGIEAGVRRFVYSSSLLVYGDRSSLVDAFTPPNPVLDYGRIKLETEKHLSQMAGSAGVALASLRLPHVYGIRDIYFKQLQAGRIFLPGRGKNVYTHLHVGDASAAIIAAAEQAYSATLPLGDRLPSTWVSFLEVAKQHYPETHAFVMPQWFAHLATFLMKPFRRFREYSGIETQGAVRSYNLNLAVDPNLVWKDLGLKLKYPTIHEGIPAAVSQAPNTCSRLGVCKIHK